MLADKPDDPFAVSSARWQELHSIGSSARCRRDPLGNPRPIWPTTLAILQGNLVIDGDDGLGWTLLLIKTNKTQHMTMTLTIYDLCM